MNLYPKISIVTPSYNQGHYLEETILSILEQNYANLEYIIIDGGSQDNSIEIIKKYEKYLHYWISEKDQGQSHAINKGLAKCSGKVFNWINSDDLLLENALKTIAYYFQEFDINVLCGFQKVYDENTGNFYLARAKIYDSLEESLIFPHICQQATFFRTDIVQSLGGVNNLLHYSMDLELWLKYLLRYGTGKIKLCGETLAVFRRHSSSKTIYWGNEYFYEDNACIEGAILQQLSAPRNLIKLASKKCCIPDYQFTEEVSRVNKKRYIDFWTLRGIKVFKNKREQIRLLLYNLQNNYQLSFGKYKRIITNYIFPKTFFKIHQFKQKLLVKK